MDKTPATSSDYGFPAMQERKRGSANKLTLHTLNLMTAGPGNFLGEEDAISGQYQVTVKCLSQVGRLYKMRREDFLKLQTQGSVWVAFML